MAILYTRKQTESLITQAVAAAKGKKQGSIREAIGAQSLDRAKADVEKWRQALDEWEDPKQPDRYEMIQLYQEIIQDDAVSSHLNDILLEIQGTEFEIGTFDKNGKFNPDTAKAELLKAEWFSEVIRNIIEAEMQGFTLMEVIAKPVEQYTTDDIQLIPRHLVIPEKGMVRTRAQVNLNLIDYTQPAYSNRLLKIGSRTEKGAFNNIALLYIYKKNALAYWANYQSKFGIPPVIVKTDLENTAKTDSLVSFLQEMRSNTFSLVGFDDEIAILNGVTADAFSTFQELIDRCDQRIAIRLEGQTMTTQDGSSRSQAEVHERKGDKLFIARLRRVEQVVNSQLFPILNLDGAALDGLSFRYKVKKDVNQVIEHLVKLKSAGFTMDAEQASELTGYTLTEAPDAPAAPPNAQPQSVMQAIDNLYKDIIR